MLDIKEKELAEQVPMGAVFQHYKGKRYKILCVARHSETLEYQVVYQGLYQCPDFGDCPIWVRPLKMFLEEVEYQGNRMPRFTLIEHSQIIEE